MIKVSVQPTLYTPIVDLMINNPDSPWKAPAGNFYLLNGVVAPYSPNPAILKIETDRIGEPIEISIARSANYNTGVDDRKTQDVYTVVSNSEVVTTGVQMGRGTNNIKVQVLNRPGEVAYLIVHTTLTVALFEAFARVLYLNSFKVIDEQKNAISSKLATRLIEPFLSFQELLPDIQSIQILASRLATRGLIHNVGFKSGVEDLIKALGLTTPVFRKMDKDTFDLDPSLDPWATVSSQFGGSEAHVWIPNVGIASWLAFLSYINNQPDLFEIVSVREDEVLVKFQGELQRHQFDFDLFGTDFLTSLAQSECFKSITVSVSMASKHLIRICAAAYTFDLFIGEGGQLGNSRSSLDIDVPFDSNRPLDSDDIDPFTDGWVGLSLTGRFEQDLPYNHVLDTFVMPSTQYTGPACGYEGFYTQIVENQNYEFDVEVLSTVSGFVQEAIPWTLQSPDLTLWDIVPNITGVLVAISGSTRIPDNFKVTKPDLSEAAFAVTNAGQLQVIYPAPGGETLRDDLYVKGTGAYVWDINVNNLNQIVTDRIFPS